MKPTKQPAAQSAVVRVHLFGAIPVTHQHRSPLGDFQWPQQQPILLCVCV